MVSNRAMMPENHAEITMQHPLIDEKPLVLILDHDIRSRLHLKSRIDKLGRYETQTVYDPMDIPATLERVQRATILISRAYAMRARRELLGLFIRLSELEQRVRIHYYREPYLQLQAHLQSNHGLIGWPLKSGGRGISPTL